VGSLAPNGYGLYDVMGNVMEWCADWYDKSDYANSPKENPKGPNSGNQRVYRGTPYRADLGDKLPCLRIAYRFASTPTATGSEIGFRCVQDVNLNGQNKGDEKGK